MRVTGRFLGFCLAATLAPVALCAAPVTVSGPGFPFAFTHASDIPPPSTGFGIQHALKRAGEAGVDPHACDGLVADGLSVGLSAVRKAADLQGPLTKPSARAGNDGDSLSTSDRVLSDGVHPTLGAHSAVLDSDKAAIGEVQPQAADPAQAPNLKVRSLTDHERAFYGVAQGGLVVTAVGQGAAQQAGFRQGDVVLMLDGVGLSDTAQFYRLIRQLPHDRPVPVLVRRTTSDLFLPLGSVRR
jgi:hypothetical protein